MIRSSWLEHLWPTTLLLIILGAAFIFKPLGSNQLALLGIPLPAFCTFRILTGIPCPFCGISRSLVNLIHGNWQDALDSHPLGPLSLSLFFLYALYRLIYGKNPKYFEAYALGLLSLFLLVWVFRLNGLNHNLEVLR